MLLFEWVSTIFVRGIKDKRAQDDTSIEKVDTFALEVDCLIIDFSFVSSNSFLPSLMLIAVGQRF